MMWKTVPNTSFGDWKRPIAVVDRRVRRTIRDGSMYNALRRLSIARIRGAINTRLYTYLLTYLFPGQLMGLVYLSSVAPPSAPRNLRVTEISRDYVVIAWEKPVFDGNEQLLGYEIEKSMAGGGGTFVSAGYVDVGTMSFRVTRLHEGCDYLFRVSAENRVGLGPPAITEQPVTVKLPFGKSEFTDTL